MRRTEIRSFVENCLALRGVTFRELGPALLEVDADLGGPDASQLLAFGSRIHRQHPEAELVAVGSAFLDRLVNEASAAGRYAVAFTPPSEGDGCPIDPAQLLRVNRGRWGKPEPYYRPLFLFVYVAEYRTIDVPDDLEFICLDPARGEVLSSAGPLLEGLKSGTDEPPPGWKMMRAAPTRGMVQQSLIALDRRLQRRARKVKEAAALEIARETANIEAYYRQLIDEVRHPVGRSNHGPENEAQRVAALQLDWKRRVQEVARFWEAGASVRLSALGVVMEPCWGIPLKGRGPRGGARMGGPVTLAADYNTGALLVPRCPLCGARLRDAVEIVGADLVCPQHLEKPPAPSVGYFDARR